MHSETFNLVTYSSKNKLSVKDKFNELCLLFNHPANANKSILLVEGNDDLDLYFKFFDQQKVKIYPVGGKSNLDELFSKLKTKDYIFFAIRDADFLRLDNEFISDKNYFLTDCHDLEMMCFNNIKSQKSFFENNAVQFDSGLILSVFSKLKVLSYLRWFNLHKALGLNFNSFSPAGKRLEDLQSVHFLIDSTLLDRNRKYQLEERTGEIESSYNDFMASHNNVDDYEVTNGHDFLSLLSDELKSRSESKNIHNYRPNVFEKCLMTGFTFELFKETKLYSQIKNWCNSLELSLFADRN